MISLTFVRDILLDLEYGQLTVIQAVEKFCTYLAQMLAGLEETRW